MHLVPDSFPPDANRMPRRVAPETSSQGISSSGRLISNHICRGCKPNLIPQFGLNIRGDGAKKGPGGNILKLRYINSHILSGGGAFCVSRMFAVG